MTCVNLKITWSIIKSSQIVSVRANNWIGGKWMKIWLISMKERLIIKDWYSLYVEISISIIRLMPPTSGWILFYGINNCVTNYYWFVFAVTTWCGR